MFLHILRFELRYWLRQPIVYVFFLVIGLLVFGATASDEITIGGSYGNVHKNAPYVVQDYYALMSLICLLMITAFLNGAAARDFSEKTSQILFSTPLRQTDFLLGRFAGAFLVSVIPFLGVSAGSLLGAVMPWQDPERIGPTCWTAHLNGITAFVLPNLFFAGAIIFSIAALTRSTLYSFLGTIGLLVGYVVSQSLVSDIENEVAGALLDPFAIRTFAVATKYWTVDDRNTRSMGWEGLLLWNRLLWVGLGVLVLLFTRMRFSFSERARRVRRKATGEETSPPRAWEPVATERPAFGGLWVLRQWAGQVRIETMSILRNLAFLVILVFGALNLVSSMVYSTSWFGTTSFPVTYGMVDIIESSFYLFIVALVTFYTGAIVWKEREARVHDIYDALPHPDWIPLASKTAAMALVVLLMLAFGGAIGIVTQWLNGFTDIRYEVYLVQLLGVGGFNFILLLVLSMCIHTVVNNRYLGYFLFVAILIANQFVWTALDVESNLVIFAGAPSMTYSDMNRFGPFLGPVLAFSTYWLLAAALMTLLALPFWVRGREQGFGLRTRLALARLPALRGVLAVLAILWLACGGWLYYDTQVRNTWLTRDQREVAQVEYERRYKRFEGRPQPRTVSLDYRIELYPETRSLEMTCRQWMRNRSRVPIDTIFLTFPPLLEAAVELPGARRLLFDSAHRFAMYRLAKPLQPGDSMWMDLSVRYLPEGIENEVRLTSIVENGSFFNNAEFLPQVGYQSGYEMSDRNRRRKRGLPLRARMPKLSDDPAGRMDSYISNNSDWVKVRSVFGTSGDQTAIAPGSLRRRWTSGGRNYFEYHLDHPSLNFYSFLSARYRLRQRTHKGVRLEVYYDPRHAYNVDKMLMSMEKSIDYYATHFGPYRHRQARIIEFPRYASFAQAFPGTMPYSEAIGFIANLEDPQDIDMVTYVVAHEMGHQWWAHQVVGPEMQGSTLLSESMAQYSALMVMEGMYGKDRMHRFLRYEMDQYLAARGGETQKETPLMEVEDQGYLHYNKASVVMYHLREMIGADRVNAALRSMVDSFAYREPPYPNANALVSRMEAETPDSLRYLVRDLFRRITLFDNRVLAASTREVRGGYETTLKVQAAKIYADSLGRETPAPLDDWMELGVFTAPAEGRKQGKALLLQRVRLRERERTFTLFTKERPWQAGIDPNHYLIDRVPADNLKKVGESGE